LKLNATKKFNTGIYPYSMMTSVFIPFSGKSHALKVSASVQEWCGHAYMELENKSQYEVNVHSYFQGENNQELSLSKGIIEDELWTLIRLNPKKLPIGELEVIPSFFYIRLLHKKFKSYKCVISSQENKKGLVTYQLFYPELDRKLIINYQSEFPYKINSWSETYFSGWGKEKKKLETKATLIKTIKVDQT